MNILLDSTLPPRFARALHILLQPDHSVVHVRDLIGNDATDQHIMDHLANHPETIVVGIDLDTTAHPHRLEFLRLWNSNVFLLQSSWIKMDQWEQAWMLTRRLQEIIKKTTASARSAIYLVPAGLGGRIRKVA
jgi:PIN like domain